MQIAELGVVSCFHEDAFPELEQQLGTEGFRLLELDGEGVFDEASFLAAAERDLPTTPGLHAHGYDALIDVLSDGLDRLEEDRLAVVWRHADMLEAGNVQQFLDAVLALTSAVRRLYGNVERPQRHVLLILLGDAPNYPAPT